MTLETTDTPLQNKTYWVQFKKTNGKIVGITKSKPSDGSTFIETTSPVIKDIVSGLININDYKVKWNFISESYDLDKKSDKLELQPIANKLEEIKQSTPQPCDVSIVIYTKDKKGIISINTSRIKKNYNISQINSIVDNEHNLMSIFVCKKNNPDSLIGTIKIDSYELFKNRSVIFDLPSFMQHNENLTHLSYFTIPLFSKYSLDFQEDFIITPTVEGKQRFINTNNLEVESQINIYTVNENTIVLNTNFHKKDYGSFGGKNTFTMIACDGSIDCFLGDITIPVSKLIEESKIKVELPFKFTETPIFVYRNNNISISYNGAYNE